MKNLYLEQYSPTKLSISKSGLLQKRLNNYSAMESPGINPRNFLTDDSIMSKDDRKMQPCRSDMINV